MIIIVKCILTYITIDNLNNAYIFNKIDKDKINDYRIKLFYETNIKYPVLLNLIVKQI